jgi:hypothetical protein
MGGNGNRLFTKKQHVQMANNPRSPQCQTEPELICPSQSPSFFVTIYLFKAWYLRGYKSILKSLEIRFFVNFGQFLALGYGSGSTMLTYYSSCIVVTLKDVRYMFFPRCCSIPRMLGRDLDPVPTLR